MSGYDIKEQLKTEISDWVANHWWADDEVISGEMATTNCIFEDAEVEQVDLDKSDDDNYTFKCQFTLSGYPRDEDCFFYGDTIDAEVSGFISYDRAEGEWKINDTDVYAEVRHDDIEEDDDEEKYYLKQVITYDNADELIVKLAKFTTGLWFRGHSDESWELKPSIAREQFPDLSLEDELRTEFKNQTVFIKPDFHKSDIAELTFMMQHHGLPTRLLDWTTSPLVALYFAVSDRGKDTEEENACILALDPSQLNRSYGEYAKKIKYEEKHFTLNDNKAFAISSPYTDLRMKAQLSEFTVHMHYDDILDHTESGLFIKEKIIINWRIKKELREKLRGLGFDKASLFPDLDNISQNIRENILGE